MIDPKPLTKKRAKAYKAVFDGMDEPHIAFVGVVPDEKMVGINGALGIAVANKRGYHPVMLGWARYASLNAAEADADNLNRDVLGLTDDAASRIVFSTMGGVRFIGEAK